MQETAPYKMQLEGTLAELETRLRRLQRDLDEPHDPDSSERAVQMEDDDSLEEQARLVTREIASVRRALDRIAADEYGYCVQCGEMISEGRLAARPEAALCIACAEKG
ncbi:conjugal transfer protein TraR [Aurantiacibacter atlanticus]|uniref:Conjugal transfer protein TraR n=1 Tax=Aurantiacibacter atlanticus TaxID=1648404 RepID=A0A0H4VDU2_9SPHN|nr:TraR/DksA C4-type zinc finger protein [Aurantiacibacter atlanticus]AKQ42857.1 conjugal transfer protein TraR [Aurantiacibacter atlanticus]MDF1834867.1 TraR/DksA C4-type zinc finger protein [Alteraurantiacibacter sp. bin_em_oilr2.035]